MTVSRSCEQCGRVLGPDQANCPCQDAPDYAFSIDVAIAAIQRSLLDRLRDAVGEKYEVERELAVGGMATVFLAYDPWFTRKVAIKVLDLRGRIDRGSAERFAREAGCVGRLNHPNVVVGLDGGEGPELHYIVLRYVDGPTLAEVLRSQPRKGIAEVLGILIDIAQGLRHAHEHGIIHRDVKPSNVLLEGDRAIVVDFGIAKSASSTVNTVEGPGPRTERYASPEQLRGEELTPATDQYSLGLVAYELFTGAQPFKVADTEIRNAHWHTPPLPLRLGRRKLEEGVLRMLAKGPGDRWPSFDALIEFLVQQRMQVDSASEEPDHASNAPTVSARGWTTAGAVGLVTAVVVFGAYAAPWRSVGSSAGSAAVVRLEGGTTRATGSQPDAPSRPEIPKGRRDSVLTPIVTSRSTAAAAAGPAPVSGSRESAGQPNTGTERDPAHSSVSINASEPGGAATMPELRGITKNVGVVGGTAHADLAGKNFEVVPRVPVRPVPNGDSTPVVAASERSRRLAQSFVTAEVERFVSALGNHQSERIAALLNAGSTPESAAQSLVDAVKDPALILTVSGPNIDTPRVDGAHAVAEYSVAVSWTRVARTSTRTLVLQVEFTMGTAGWAVSRHHLISGWP